MMQQQDIIYFVNRGQLHVDSYLIVKNKNPFYILSNYKDIKILLFSRDWLIKGLLKSYWFSFQSCLCLFLVFSSFLSCLLTILSTFRCESAFDYALTSCDLSIKLSIFKFLSLSFFGLAAILAKSELLFFFKIFYDFGASGSFLLIFLSNFPMDAVLSYAS